MYSLKSEDYFTSILAENTSPPYTLPLNDFGETNDQLADQTTTLSGQINAANYCSNPSSIYNAIDAKSAVTS